MGNLKGPQKGLAIGDTVTYSAAFCRSCGIWQYDLANRRGLVVEIHPTLGEQFVRVLWDDEKAPQLVCRSGLWPVGKLHLELLCD
jgi:hypothetical protein